MQDKQQPGRAEGNSGQEQVGTAYRHGLKHIQYKGLQGDYFLLFVMVQKMVVK